MEVDQNFFTIKDIKELININFEDQIIGFNPTYFAIKQIENFKFNTKSIQGDIFKDLNIHKTKCNVEVFSYPLEYSGTSIDIKLSMIRDAMRKMSVDYCLLTNTSSVSWLFNIRSYFVPYSLVVPAYSLISQNKIIIFTDGDIEIEGVETFQMTNIVNVLSTLSGTIILNKATCPFSLFDTIKNCSIIDGDPCELPKAIKSETEINNFKQVLIKESSVLCEFFCWLENNQKDDVTEYDLSEKLISFRKKHETYISESFAAICGYQENSSIIHYHATKRAAKTLKKEGMLLVDTGGHYLGGTTDTSRTITLGIPTEKQILMYTLVLKGHIRLSMTKFPKGTKGQSLDAIARIYLWNIGKDYPHATSHGVGNMLNIHEGPQGISLNNQIPFEEGMIISNEPGFYEDFGIRIENLMYVTKFNDNFMKFKTITLVPYCHKLINYNMLDKDEISYLKNYYMQINENIIPNLSIEAKRWVSKEIEYIL